MIAPKTLLKILINSLIGFVLILVWLRFVNISEILSTLASIQLINIIPIFIFMLVSPFFRALRFKYLLAPIKKISLKDLFYLNGVAMMLSFLIPIRAGELAKGVYLSGNYNLPIGKSIVWVFLDRFLDFMVVLVLSLILLLLVPTNLNITFITVITVIFLLGIILTYLIIWKADLARKLFKLLSYLLILNSVKIYFERLFNFLIETFKIFRRSPQDLLTLVLISVLAYAADAAIWYVTFLALGSNQDFIKMYLAQLLSALTYLIPAAPGYIGSAEASGALIFSGVLGIETNLASAMIVLFHICTLIFVLAYGIISVYLLKIDLGSILVRIFRKGD